MIYRLNPTYRKSPTKILDSARINQDKLQVPNEYKSKIYIVVSTLGGLQVARKKNKDLITRTTDALANLDQRRCEKMIQARSVQLWLHILHCTCAHARTHGHMRKKCVIV